MMKKLFAAVITTGIIVCCGAAFAAAPVKPTNEFYVNDYANLLPGDVAASLVEKGKALYDATGAQVVLVTLQSLDGRPLEEVSIDIARDWGIGDKEKRNGVLILLALEERKTRIEIGLGLEGDLPDGKTGRMQDDYMIPYLKNDDYESALKSGYMAFDNEVYRIYGLEPIDELQPAAQEDEGGGAFEIIIVIVLVVLFMIIGPRRRRGFWGGGGGHGGGGSDSGGGFGGGSSGGGGSFGGGGSSRSW